MTAEPECPSCEEIHSDEWDNNPDPLQRHQHHVRYICIETGGTCDVENACPAKKQRMMAAAGGASVRAEAQPPSARLPGPKARTPLPPSGAGWGRFGGNGDGVWE